MQASADLLRLAKQWKWAQRAIMANTALATAGGCLMAAAFRQAIEAGRKAYLSGLGRVLTRGASASDPLTGFLRD